MSKIAKKFYNQPTLQVARELLGTILVHQAESRIVAGKIVETEAYLQGDPACHANQGPTKRNASMFGPPGHSYVYLIYGIHYCFNVVTMPAGVGEAVLIRALEPLKGLALMQQRRNQHRPELLCAGPGRLCQALGITMDHDGISLSGDKLWLEKAEPVQADNIIITTRIGITQGADLPYRFYIANNKYVSRK
ncbi:MAG: DNA-3-methyladenine glycosylase [Firmicutes bacterium]|nr:DNA-3-methyladenine glycosylase [Bacillota bacterium]